MKKRLVASVSGAVVAVCLIGTASASAATEFGDNCVGDEVTESTPVTLFAITAAGDPLPITAPSAGVITQWKVNVVPTPFSFPQTLKVLRQTGSNTVQVIGEATGTVTGGQNSFATRIPVHAGDHLGLFGTSQTFESGGEEVGNLLCELPPTEKNRIGGFEGGGALGATSSFIEIESEIRLPVSATIEPDADGDGFGDETQDKCPQSAATQAPCPVVTLSTSATAGKSLATVLVTSNLQASVTVAGSVKLGKGKPATLSGGTQVVAPGALAKFVVVLPAKVKSKLKQLSPKQHLTLSIATTAPNVVGAPTASSLSVKLKGQAKPNKPKAKQHTKPKS
jgi:hypothetical protein